MAGLTDVTEVRRQTTNKQVTTNRSQNPFAAQDRFNGDRSEA
jgi:hypothetical protein